MQDNSLDNKITDENKIIPPRPPQPGFGINDVSARYQSNSKDILKKATKDIIKVCNEEADIKGMSTANDDSRIYNEENTKLTSLKSVNMPQKLNNNHAITASPSLLDGLKQKISKKIEETALNYQHNHPDSGLGNALLDHLTHSASKPQIPSVKHTHMVQLQESNSVGHTHRRSSILSNHLPGAGFKYENKVAPLPPSSSANNLQDVMPTNEKLPKFSAMYNKLEDKVKTNSHINNDNNKTNKENQDDFDKVTKPKPDLSKPKKGLVPTLRTLREHGSSSSSTLSNNTTIIPKVDPIFSSNHSLQDIISPRSLNAVLDETSTSLDINVAGEALPDSEALATNTQTPPSAPSSIPNTNIWGFCDTCILPHGIKLPRPVSVACSQIIAILRHGTPIQHCSNQGSHSALSIFILFTILSLIITLLLAIHYSTHSGYTKLIYLFFNFIAILTRAYHSGFIFFSAGFATAIASIYFYDYTFGTCIKETHPCKAPSGPVKYTEDFETITKDATIPDLKLKEDLPAPVRIKDENNDDDKVNDVNALGTAAATTNTLRDNSEFSRAKISQAPKVPPFPNYRSKHPFRVDTYQGWINELTVAYDFETYRVQQTRSVYITLEGRFLKMSIPKKKVSKRSVWDEKPIDVSTLAFIDHRYYDLSESVVYLQPQDLPKKVYWSKKYPISIKLFHKNPLQKAEDDGRVPRSPTQPPKQSVSIGVSAHYPNVKTGPSSAFKTNHSTVASDIGAKLKGKIGKPASTFNSGFVGGKGGSESLKDYVLPITDRDGIQMREVKSSLGVEERESAKSRSPSPIDRHAKDDLSSKKCVKFSKETKFELKEAKVEDGPKEEPIAHEERIKVKEPEVLLGDVYLHLFSRTNRDKEEWFWRFLRASRGGGAGGTSHSGVKRWLNASGGGGARSGASFATTLDPRSSTAVWTSAGGSGLDGEPDCGSVFVPKHNAASSMDKPHGIYFDPDLYTNIQDLRLYLTPAIFDELLTPDDLASDLAETRFLFANNRDKDCYTSSTSTTSMPNAELGYKKDNSAASNGEKLKKNRHKNINSDHQTTGLFKENQKGQNRGILTYALVRELNPLRIHPELCWLNAFIQRLAWDFFKHKFMTQNIINKLKRKLNKVKLPYFVEPLSLLDLDFGSILPSGRLATRPWTNERGIWTEIVISFTGIVSLTLSTKVNLMKLKAGNPECSEISEEHLALPHSPHRHRKHVTHPHIKIDSGHAAEQGPPSLEKSDSEQDIPRHEEEFDGSKFEGEDVVVQGEEAMPFLNQSFNLWPPPPSYLTKRRRTWASRGSESEDSPESSDEEVEMSDNSSKGVSVKGSGKEVGTSTNQHSAINSSNPPSSPNMAHQSTGKKILKMVDKIANSKYFQQAAEMKYIKRGMEAVSNTPIVLTVELTHFEGIMALNIPEPPSDRLWYGFRPKPEMKLASKPKLGAKHVNITQVTDWIEKTLLSEFEKLLVIPNMDDVIVPIMMSGQIYPPLNPTPPKI